MFIATIARVGYRYGGLSLHLSRYCANCNISAVTGFKAIKLYSTQTKAIHEINTNVAKDVILFNYENPRYFKLLNIFALVQYGFWAYLASFAYTSMRDAPVDKTKIDESTSWIFKVNLGENKYKNSLTAIALIIGVGTLCLSWMFTLRSVRYLILHKGGQHITFVTYTPFGKNRMMKVPVENISCKASRFNTSVQVPIKIKNTWWHYMLDMRGEFKNGSLFDSTAGLYRGF